MLIFKIPKFFKILFLKSYGNIKKRFDKHSGKYHNNND